MQEIKKVMDMELCEEYQHVIGVSCNNCDSCKVKLLGTYERDEKGLYIDIICLSCGWMGEDGDGDFDDYFIIVEGQIHRKEEFLDDVDLLEHEEHESKIKRLRESTPEQLLQSRISKLCEAVRSGEMSIEEVVNFTNISRETLAELLKSNESISG